MMAVVDIFITYKLRKKINLRSKLERNKTTNEQTKRSTKTKYHPTQTNKRDPATSQTGLICTGRWWRT